MRNRILCTVLLSILLYSSMFVQAQENDCEIPEGWSRTYIVQAGENLFRIALNNNISLDQLAEANCITDTQTVFAGQTLYLPTVDESINGFIALTLASSNDDGQSGVLMGCDGSAVQIATTRPATGDIEMDLRMTFEAMLGEEYRNPSSLGLNNTWGGFQITIDDVSVTDGVATIALSGDFIKIGVCGDALYEDQLRHNILMYPQIESALVTMNGENMRVIFDESGLVSSDAQFDRTRFTPDRCPIPLGWVPYQIPIRTNLFRISIEADSDYQIIADRNCIEDPSQIEAGEFIYLPETPS